MFDQMEIRGHSLCQHAVESVLHAWQERGLATETATSIIQTVQNTVKAAQGWEI